jgi:hypothetical protein
MSYESPITFRPSGAIRKIIERATHRKARGAITRFISDCIAVAMAEKNPKMVEKYHTTRKGRAAK